MRCILIFARSACGLGTFIFDIEQVFFHFSIIIPNFHHVEMRHFKLVVEGKA